MRHLPHAALIALGLALPAPVPAQETTLPGGTPVRPADAEKLADFDSHVGAALRQALQEGSGEDVEILVRSLRGTPMPAETALRDLQGDWRCRTIKAGEIAALVVYQDFACRFDGEGFEKLTGSQRTRGTVHADDGRLIYLGTGFVEGSEVPAYADLPEDPLNAPGAGQIWADIGVVEMVAPDRARIVLPDPDLESRMNVIWLTR